MKKKIPSVLIIVFLIVYFPVGLIMLFINILGSSAAKKTPPPPPPPEPARRPVPSRVVPFTPAPQQYDYRAVVKKCDSCGAKTTLLAGTVKRCDYCGTHLSAEQTPPSASDRPQTPRRPDPFGY